MQGSNRLKLALRSLASELRKEQDKSAHYRKLFEFFFPIRSYILARPDVVSYSEGDNEKVILHYINQGHAEITGKSLSTMETDRLLSRCLKNTVDYFKEITLSSRYASKKSVSTKKPRRLELRKTLGNNKSMEHNQEHIFALQRTLVHLKSNSIFTWIPKNGCSSFRFSIALANGVITSRKDIEYIHNIHMSLCATVKELLQAKYCFVVLRNPFKRLLSYFMDKICHTTSMAANDTSYKEAQDLFNVTDSTTFEEFVSFMWHNPEVLTLDQHLTPQVDFLIYREYDDYYQFESFSEMQSSINEKIGLELVDVRDFNSIYTTKGFDFSSTLSQHTPVSLIRQHCNEGKKPVALNMFTDEMAKKVAAMYFNDIILYINNIENGYEELEPWIRKVITTNA